MPQINLLPQEIQTRARSRRAFLATVAGAVVVLLFLVVLYLVQRNTIGNEEEKLRDLQAQASDLRAQVARLQEFGDRKARIDSQRATLAIALTGEVAWSKFLNDVSLVMPDNAWLSNMTLAASPGTAPSGEPSVGTTTYTGFTIDFPGLAGWLIRMEQLDGLTFVYLTTGAEQELNDVNIVSFSANANVTPAMLSLRCVEESAPCP